MEHLLVVKGRGRMERGLIRMLVVHGTNEKAEKRDLPWSAKSGIGQRYHTNRNVRGIINR